MKKELLTIEFRYNDRPKSEAIDEYRNKTITIGIFDTIEEAVEKGNKTLDTLSKYFEVRFNDKFQVRGLFGCPHRLVTNCCYPTKGISYFAKIEQLKFYDLSDTIKETFEAAERYKIYREEGNDD